MYLRPSVPQAIGGVLDDAIQLFRACLPRCWLLALASQAAAALPGLLLRSQIRHWTITDPFAALAALKSGNFVACALFGMVIFVVFNLALIDNMNGVALGAPASLGRSIGVGIRAFPRGLVATVLVALIVGFGFVLLIVPGIYWAGSLMLTFVVLVVEDAGILQSLAGSNRLISGHWWRSATIYSVAIIIAAVFYFLLGLSGALTIALLDRQAWVAIDVQLLLSIFGNALFTIALTATLLAVYRDLRLRREGGGLAPPAGPAAVA